MTFRLSLWRRLLPAAGLTALLAAGGACGDRQQRLTIPDDTPVILISIDTLRSDRLPVYGYQGVLTPAIDRLRADSILFERAYSHVPLTLPSHASILTGLLPDQHRVRDNIGYRLQAKELPSLPRLLRQSGYLTGAAVSAYVLRGATGMADEFDFYEDQIEMRTRSSLGGLQRGGFDTLAAAKPWLDSIGDRPFFFLFHIYEPHTPYEPPEPYASQYPDPYDGEVATADAVIGEFLDYLEDLGVYDRALIIFLSDHGEGLWDHGALEHMVLLYREIIQVPLMIKLPHSQRGGETESRPAQLIDVLPTIVDLLRIEPQADIELRGTSLLRLAELPEDRFVFSETHYPRLHFGWSQLASLTDGRYHYIHGPDPELYDMREDFTETRNILRQERRIFGLMKKALENHELEIQPPSEVDPEAREKLAALGYLGSTGGDSPGPLADPKAKLHILKSIFEARSLSANDDFERAVEILERVVEEEPLLTDAWQQLAQDLAQLERFEEAEAAIREAMTLSGGASNVALEAAEIYRKMGRTEDARAHADLAKETHEAAWDVLAQIAIEEGDLENAERYVQEAIDRRGTRFGPLLTEAALRVAQERFEEAIQIITRVEREFGDRSDRRQLSGMYFTRGKAHAFLGETDEATADFLAEIELSPKALGAYTHLAFLYALEGKGPEAGLLLKRMVEANPTAEAHAAAVVALREMGDPRSAAAVLEMALRRWPEDERLRQLAG